MMQNGIEKFIGLNRQAFDDAEPGGEVWGNIEKQFVQVKNAVAGNADQGLLEGFVKANREAFDDAEPSTEVWGNLEKRFAAQSIAENRLENFVQENRLAFDDVEPSAKIWGSLEKRFVTTETKVTRLEKFVDASRQAFDDAEPSTNVWSNLETQFAAKPAKTISITRTLYFRLSAAAVFIVAAASLWLLMKKDSATVTNPANNTVAVAVPKDTVKQQAPVITPPSQEYRIADNVKKAPVTKDTAAAADDNGTSEELFYYTKLTELKFKQLKKIETEEPFLYKNFYSEIKKLDSTYHNLQALLATNADKETVLNAMLTNLKIETEVLNKQLAIIRTIKQSKKKQYENDSKSV